jgi:putative Mn2+ efflux pump MntP
MKIIKDMIEQLWTLLGMFVAWVVLEGTAKTFVGWVILITCGIWMATFPLRNKDNWKE